MSAISTVLGSLVVMMLWWSWPGVGGDRCRVDDSVLHMEAVQANGAPARGWEVAIALDTAGQPGTIHYRLTLDSDGRTPELCVSHGSWVTIRQWRDSRGSPRMSGMASSVDGSLTIPVGHGPESRIVMRWMEMGTLMIPTDPIDTADDAVEPARVDDADPSAALPPIPRVDGVSAIMIRMTILFVVVMTLLWWRRRRM